MRIRFMSGTIIIHAFKRYLTISKTGITSGKVKSGFNQRDYQ